MLAAGLNYFQEYLVLEVGKGRLELRGVSPKDLVS